MSLTTELLRFIQRAGVARDATRILADMSRFIARAFAVHRVSVYVFEQGLLRPLASEYRTGETRPELWKTFQEMHRLDHLPFARRMMSEPGPLLHVDPRDGFGEEMVRTFDIRPYLALPLLGEDEDLVGVVLIEGDPDELVSQEDELVELASFVSLAVQNAQAFRREQQRAGEAEALLTVSAVLTRYTDPTRVLASVAQHSARATGFERASIFIVDDDGRLVPTMSQFADGHADSVAWERFNSMRHEVPACRRVLETGEPLVISDASTSRDLIHMEWWEPFGLRSMLVVPLTAWGERFGAMVLDHRRVSPVSPDQTRVALAVASHGAAAIGLSRLLAAEREAKERLAELDRLKTAFVATVSHELRTPLTTIVGFTQVLPDMVAGEAAEFVSIMGRESLHLEALIANLLDTSRLEAGILDIRREDVDLTKVARDAVDLVSHLHPDVEMSCQIGEGIRLASADGPRLRQVVVNLLENGCKYGAGAVSLHATALGDGARIEVEDRGAGIPAASRDAVFDRFHRLHEGQESGTGIGLYLVKALVEAHGGKVWITDGSRLGGARFVVDLPFDTRRLVTGAEAGARYVAPV